MISQTILLWMATVGLLVDYVALGRANDGQSRAIALGIGLMLWAGFAVSAMGFKTTTNAGVVIIESSQMLAVIGAILVMINIVLLLETVLRGITEASP